ncbi:MAG: glycosyltransferase [Verrucomicrobiales bacterium]
MGCLSVEKPSLSFIIQVVNEQGNVKELFDRIREQAIEHSREWEVVFIDDGSTDASWQVIEKLSEHYPQQVEAIRFRSNQGKSAALNAGFDRVKYEIIFTLDADLRDDPTEIPRFLEKLDEGYDIVSGWRRRLHEPWYRSLPGSAFNKLFSNLHGVHLHDHKCDFNCYRRDVVKALPMYGDMHRMVPSMASIDGFKSAEIPVEHHARPHTGTENRVTRLITGVMDIWSVYFLKNFRESPQHFLGGVALAVGSFGAALWLFSVLINLPVAFAVAGPVLVGTALCILMIGFVAELKVHQHLNGSHSHPIIDAIEKLAPGTMGKVVRLSSIRGGFSISRVQSPKEKHALVVDDCSIMRRIISKALIDEGWRVMQAEDGASASGVTDETISVIFLDIEMPHVNGLALIPRLKRQCPNAMIFMVSSDDDIRAGVEAIKRGADDYICKPVTPERVADLAQSALDYSSDTIIALPS